MILTKVSKNKLPKQWKILAETYLTYAPLASFVTPSTKDHEVRDRLAHTTDDVVKKARCACTHDVVVVPVMLVKPTDTSPLAFANISPPTKIPTSLST